MNRTNLRKTFSTTTFAGGTIMTANALAQAQGGNGQGYGMMGGNGSNWMGSYGAGMVGYGGWLPILLVIVIVGLVVWVVTKKKK